MSTRLNININETLLTKLRIIAAIDGTTVTDIITNLISDFVDKKKDISQKKISEIFTTARKPENQSSQLQQLISEFAKNNPDAVKIGSDGKRYIKAEPKFGQWLSDNNFSYDQAKTKELGYKQLDQEMPDHWHCIFELQSLDCNLRNFITSLKSMSSRKIKAIIPTWQGYSASYYLATLSQNGNELNNALEYVKNQHKNKQ